MFNANSARKPIERPPSGVPLPFPWHAQHAYGVPYRPRDRPFQEDWASVARQFGVGVKELIYFNFMTDDPDVVNWCLKHYVGCDKVSPSGNNWMFSNSARPGIIYIPPLDDDAIDYDPEQMCYWMPDSAKEFLMRLVMVSRSMSGDSGRRIQKLVQVILRVGYPACKDLWFYNDMNVTAFVDFLTTEAKHRDMIKGTGGGLPFDGGSGLYRQSGTHEESSGRWRIHAVADLFDEFACGQWDAAALAKRLRRIDDSMYAGWYQMTLANAKTVFGGGDAVSTLVKDFIRHVELLTHDERSLYSAFPSTTTDLSTIDNVGCGVLGPVGVAFTPCDE